MEKYRQTRDVSTPTDNIHSKTHTRKVVAVAILRALEGRGALHCGAKRDGKRPSKPSAGKVMSGSDGHHAPALKREGGE
jgi:hypothetical protein